MDDRKQAIITLCNGFGWITIHSRDPHMLSFVQEETERRLNVYFTTMSVAIQDESHHQQYHRNVSLEQLELILTT